MNSDKGSGHYLTFYCLKICSHIAEGNQFTKAEAKPNNVESDHRSVKHRHTSVECDYHLVDPYYPLVASLDIPSLGSLKNTIYDSIKGGNSVESIKNSARCQICELEVLEASSCRFHLFHIGHYSPCFFSH